MLNDELVGEGLVPSRFFSLYKDSNQLLAGSSKLKANSEPRIANRKPKEQKDIIIIKFIFKASQFFNTLLKISQGLFHFVLVGLTMKAKPHDLDSDLSRPKNWK
jgi:hypothetical protein